VIVGRQIMDAHLRACLHCGIKISGTNAEVMPGQWEFQVGPCEGITSGDEMWMARYLLLRCAELFGVTICWDPKPVMSNDWNGSGCHTNYSTEGTRNDGGMQVILDMMSKLEDAHLQYIKITGVDNEKRLSGKCETSDLRVFSFGVANRGASIRIPRTTEKNQKGYLEDRRPASNMDPYVITAALADITTLNSETFPIIVSSYEKYLGTLKR
jgi:glutamine synthetase